MLRHMQDGNYSRWFWCCVWRLGDISSWHEIGNDLVFLVFIYRPPYGPKQPFLYQLQHQVERLPRQDFDRVIVLGDFNLDQKSPQHRDCFAPFCEYFEIIQRCTWSTLRWGGISDLVFDTDQSKQPVDWMPPP